MTQYSCMELMNIARILVFRKAPILAPEQYFLFSNLVLLKVLCLK